MTQSGATRDKDWKLLNSGHNTRMGDVVYNADPGTDSNVVSLSHSPREGKKVAVWQHRSTKYRHIFMPKALRMSYRA